MYCISPDIGYIKQAVGTQYDKPVQPWLTWSDFRLNLLLLKSQGCVKYFSSLRNLSCHYVEKFVKHFYLDLKHKFKKKPPVLHRHILMYCASSFLRFCIAEAHGVWVFPPSSAGWTSFFVSLFRNCSTLSEQINVMSQKKEESRSLWTKVSHVELNRIIFFVTNKKLWMRAIWKNNFEIAREVFTDLAIWQYGNMAIWPVKKTYFYLPYRLGYVSPHEIDYRAGNL